MNIVVNYERLAIAVDYWRETFNDCACCPCYGDCDEEADDDLICRQRIIRWIGALDEVVKPQ